MIETKTLGYYRWNKRKKVLKGAQKKGDLLETSSHKNYTVESCLFDFLNLDLQLKKLTTQKCQLVQINFILFLKKYFTYWFIFREKGRMREREGSINAWLPLAHFHLRTWPATQTRVLTGNWTGHPLVYRPVLNPLSYTSQGQILKSHTKSFFSSQWWRKRQLSKTEHFGTTSIHANTTGKVMIPFLPTLAKAEWRA